jgi:CHRD domain-containing protein
MLKNGSRLAFATGLVLFACGGSSSSNRFVANLIGASEAPPVSTSATGTATITLDGSTMNYTITASGLSTNAVAAHIHVGPPGVAGPVVVPFSNFPSSTAPSTTGSFTAANIVNPTNPPLNPPVATMDDLVAQMRAGNAYVNIHTSSNTGGEIRGQLAAQ